MRKKRKLARRGQKRSEIEAPTTKESLSARLQPKRHMERAVQNRVGQSKACAGSTQSCQLTSRATEFPSSTKLGLLEVLKSRSGTWLFGRTLRIRHANPRHQYDTRPHRALSASCLFGDSCRSSAHLRIQRAVPFCVGMQWPTVSRVVA